MDHLGLAFVLVVLGVALSTFGWAVANRKFDLVFGNLTADTTDESAWEAAHKSAGRGFLRLGVLLMAIGAVVVVVGMPIGGWLASAAMAALVIGVYVVAVRSFASVARHQIKR